MSADEFAAWLEKLIRDALRSGVSLDEVLAKLDLVAGTLRMQRS